MEKKEHKVVYQFGKVNELNDRLASLAKKAKSASGKAYAPYSKFRVGAAVELENGKVILGNNQENASYPAGLCAERVAIFYANSNFPELKKTTIAIYAPVTEKHIIPSPCGNCRQVIAEFRNIQSSGIEVLLINSHEDFWLFEDILELLPYDFNSMHLSSY